MHFGALFKHGSGAQILHFPQTEEAALVSVIGKNLNFACIKLAANAMGTELLIEGTLTAFSSCPLTGHGDCH